MNALTTEQCQAALAKLPNWHLKNGKLKQTFVFKNFNEAFAFMTRVAMHAEQHDHHPEWSNVYKTVEVNLVTHDANGVTEKDLKLARFMDKVAAS